MSQSEILQNKRIYVVEDNPDNIYILLVILRQAGANVTVDWWAKGEGHQILKALPIDVIILDLMLLGTNTGYDVFQEIRMFPQLAAVPIVAVSAADASTAVPKVRAMGFAGFIRKPIDADLFPMQIKSIIDGESVWFYN
jgi:two-component system cell cycle response regulator DivK